MPRQTSESLLISAAINSHDPYFWKQWGVTSRNFHGYRDEAEWLEAFGKDYMRTPSWDEFHMKWPDFPMNREQEDGKYLAVEVIDQYNTRVSTRAMLRATNLIKGGDVNEGLKHLKEMDIHTVVDAPKNLLIDYSLLDDYHTPEDRIEVPWHSLQSRTSGIGKGELWYFAARPSQGKSALTSYMAANAALQGRRVIIYSMEMTQRAMMVRLQVMMASLLGIDASHYAIKTRRMDPRAYKQLVQEIEERVPGVIHVHTPKEGPCRPSVVAARAGDYDLNVIDYIGLMRPDGAGRAVDDWRTMAGISNEIKEIALARDTRMLVASQVNREGESSKRPPKLVNLSQSDALGQDGDVVATLSKYKGRKGASHLSLEKNREGEAQIQWFTDFDVDHGNYTEITRDEADDLADEYGDED